MLSAELEGGVIVSEEGTRITDRFNAGGNSLPRLRPQRPRPARLLRRRGRVTCAARSRTWRSTKRSAATTTASCGSTRASRSACREEYGIYGGVFADIGSLWGLDDTNGSMGEVDDGFHVRSSVGVSLFVDTPFAPLRFNYADPDPERGLRRGSSGSASRCRPGSEPWRRAGARASRWRSAPRPARGAGGRPAQEPRAAARFLFLNQERILTGSQAGQALLAEEERRATSCAPRPARIDTAFEAEERRLTEQRPTLPPEEFRKSPTSSTRASSRRGASRTSASAALAQEFDQRRRQFYAQVAPILVMLMERYGAQAIFDENSVLLGRPGDEHHRGGDRRDRRQGRAARRPAPKPRSGPADAGAGRRPGRRTKENGHGTGDRSRPAPGGHPDHQADDPAPLPVPADRPRGEHRGRKAAVGIKNVTVNEPHFEGHFPVRPVMPGVLIIEAMAQTSAVLVVADPRADRQRPAWSIS